MAQSTEYRDLVWYAAKLAASLLLLVVVLYLASEVLLLVFAGILVAILLSAPAHWLQDVAGIPYGGSLAIVAVTITAALFGFGYFAAPSIGQQMDQLADRIPDSIQQLRDQVKQYPWGKWILAQGEQPLDTGEILSRATGVVSGTFGFLTSFVIVLFIGIYAAVEPFTYRRGFLLLIPPERRARMDEIISGVVDTLQWWLIGKFISMAIVGVLTTIGLWVMGIPLALALGLIAALFTFVPNIGPIVSAIPAVLLGLTESPQKALYVGVLYAAIQTVESYIITPLIQKRTVSLPPALTLSAQVFLGVVFGIFGVILATPMTAAALTVTRMLYVKDAKDRQ